MGKIFLKVPSLIAAFYRGSDADHPLSNEDAYTFTEGTAEYQALLFGLRYCTIEEQVKYGCYSLNSWKQMLKGCSLDNGILTIKRDKSSWLTAQELCMLTGKRYTDRQAIFDYLCIGIPSTMYVEGRVRRVNDNFALDRGGAMTLRRMLVVNFYRVYAQWYLVNKELMQQLGVKRTGVDFINRFLFAHNISISATRKEEELLRKIIGRGIDGNLIIKDERERLSIKILSEIYSDEKKAENGS